ncbi:hypothetical protein RSOL_041410, partial [Rhizoctonia solani AG-3 Rhs1AP]
MSTPEWWRGVVAYGYVAGLTGDYRFFIWAGQWDEDFDGKHIEVMQIRNIMGLFKETSVHWRQGEEAILWLETKGGYSYALTEPAEEYNHGSWDQVVRSWTKLPDGQSQACPGFSVVARKDAKPSWWKGDAAQKAWDHFQKPIKAAQKAEQATKRKEEKEDQKRRKSLQKMLEGTSKAQAKGKGAGQAKAKGKGKGKGTGNAKAKEAPEEQGGSLTDGLGSQSVGAEGSSAGTKRKREDPGYDQSRLRKRKSDVSYVELDDIEEEDAMGEKESSPDPIQEPSSPLPEEHPSPSKAKQPIRVKSPKKTRTEQSTNEKEPASLARDNQTLLSQGSSAVTNGEAVAEQQASSQPTKALEGLTIGGSSPDLDSNMNNASNHESLGFDSSGLPAPAEPGATVQLAAPANATAPVLPTPQLDPATSTSAAVSSMPAAPVEDGHGMALQTSSAPSTNSPSGSTSVADSVAALPSSSVQADTLAPAAPALTVASAPACLSASTGAPAPAPIILPNPTLVPALVSAPGPVSLSAITPTPAAAAPALAPAPAFASAPVLLPAPAPPAVAALAPLAAPASGALNVGSSNAAPLIGPSTCGPATGTAVEAAPPATQETSEFDLDNMTGRPSSLRTR